MARVVAAKEYQWFPQGDGVSFSDPGNWYDTGPNADIRNPAGPPGPGDTAGLGSGATATSTGAEVDQLNGVGTATLTLLGPFHARTVAGGGMTLTGTGLLSADSVTSLIVLSGGRLEAVNYVARAMSATAGGALVVKNSIQSPGAPESFLIHLDTGASLSVAGAAIDVDGSIDGGARAIVGTLSNRSTRKATLSVAGRDSLLRVLADGLVRNGSLDVGAGARLDVGGSLALVGASLDGSTTAGSSQWKGAQTQITVGGDLEVGTVAGSYRLDVSAAQVVGHGDLVLGVDAETEGILQMAEAGNVEVAAGTVVVGRLGRGSLSVGDLSWLITRSVVIGRSSADNAVAVSGGAAMDVLEEMLVGEGGRGRLQLESGAAATLKRLVVGRSSSADNRVAASGSRTALSVSGRIDVGELRGTGTLDLSVGAEARPTEGLSVGIYDGSVGSLNLRDGAQIITPGAAIFGGGAASTSTVSIARGGHLSAFDVLIFARPTGSSSVEVKAGAGDLLPTLIQAGEQIDVGFTRGDSGPTLLRISDGAFAAVGSALYVGPRGRFDATTGRVKVGVTDFPAAGIVRVGPAGTLRGSGNILGTVEVENGGTVAPGASPGILTVQGDYVQRPGSRLEIEVAGGQPGVEYDQLHVAGAAKISGGSLMLRFVDGFAPRRSQTFAFLQADGLAGSFTNIEVSGVAPGFAYRLTSEGSGKLALLAETDGVAISPPRLAIERAPTGVRLSWPASGNGILESTTALGTSWIAVGTTPALDGDRWTVSVPTIGPARFFRLR